MTVMLDTIAEKVVEDGGEDALQMVLEMHAEHLAKPDCECPFGPDKQTALMPPDKETIIIVSEPEPNLFIITGHEVPAEITAALQEFESNPSASLDAILVSMLMDQLAEEGAHAKAQAGLVPARTGRGEAGTVGGVRDRDP